jgi:hypothetical protein
LHRTSVSDNDTSPQKYIFDILQITCIMCVFLALSSNFSVTYCDITGYKLVHVHLDELYGIPSNMCITVLVCGVSDATRYNALQCVCTLCPCHQAGDLPIVALRAAYEGFTRVWMTWYTQIIDGVFIYG